MTLRLKTITRVKTMTYVEIMRGPLFNCELVQWCMTLGSHLSCINLILQIIPQNGKSVCVLGMRDCMMFSVQRNISLLFPFHIHHVPLRLSLIMLEVIEVSVRS